jgi:hypothetical protein
MATEAELQAENERLRQELNAARAPQAGAVYPGVVQYENAAAGAWQNLDAEIKRLEKEQVAAWEEGRFAEATAVQKQIALATTRQEQARQEYNRWNNMRSASPVEQYLAAHAGVYSPEEANFIRRHPHYATDPQFQARIIEEHHKALGDGYQRGTTAYIARMDRAAADLGGGGADYGPAPMLSGTLLDVARSSYGAIHPEKGGVSSPEEVSRWWHEMRNSSAAHRIRENWLTAEDDKSRW